jgi:3-oxoacyl-[acyl-carrier-protein] synthase-3
MATNGTPHGKVTATITAIGGYVPEYRLTNAELEQMVDTTNEWILERTGINERRILRDGRTNSDMAVEAVKQICAKRGLDPMEIDLLVCATVTPDMVFPAMAQIVADKLGAKNAWGFDMNAACSGFLYALATVAQFVETGRYKKVVLVGADKMSAIIDYQDRNTCIIFGDGAGAVLLEPTTDGTGVRDFVFYADGAGRAHLHMKAGGSARPASIETVTNREHFAYQEGKPVFKAAVTGMAQATSEIMQRNNLSADDIAFLVPHQANKRIIDATREKMGLTPEKVMLNIQRYGNTTDGTIPLCLVDYEKQLKKGDNLVLAAFGGGFTWGALWLKWGY